MHCIQYSGWNNSVHVLDTDACQWHELVTKVIQMFPQFSDGIGNNFLYMQREIGHALELPMLERPIKAKDMYSVVDFMYNWYPHGNILSVQVMSLLYRQDTRMNDLHYLDLETGTWSGRFVCFLF